MKKILSLLFVAAMLINCMVITASATTAPEGTPISTVAEFKQMTNGNYYLANDIDFSAEATFTDYVVEKFSGTLDGNGKTIKNIKINAEGAGGVFKFVAFEADTTIKNITVENVTMTLQTSVGSNVVGFLAAYQGTSQTAGTASLTLENVNVSGTMSGFTSIAGGLVGSAKVVTVRNCHTDGSFDIDNGHTHEDRGGKVRRLGGFFGETRQGTANIYDSSNSIDVGLNRGDGFKIFSPSAGFVGYACVTKKTTDTINIYNCVNFGDIYQPSFNRHQYSTSGFVGRLGSQATENAAVISGCINFGSITNGCSNGSFVGNNQSPSLVVRDCVAYGVQSISAQDAVKGVFVGTNDGVDYGTTAAFTVSDSCVDKTADTFAAGTSDDIAVVGFQESAAAGGKFNVRMAASLKNTSNYTRIGFEVTTYVMTGEAYVVKTPAKECFSVFAKLNGSTPNGITKSYDASDFDAEHLFALTLTNVPVAENNTVLIIVRPYAVSGGTTVYGDYVAATYSNGVFVAAEALA